MKMLTNSLLRRSRTVVVAIIVLLSVSSWTSRPTPGNSGSLALAFSPSCSSSTRTIISTRTSIIPRKSTSHGRGRRSHDDVVVVTSSSRTGGGTSTRIPITILAMSTNDEEEENNNTKKTKKKETSLQRMRRRKVKILERRKNKNTIILMTLWYILSVGFNIYSKRALNIAPKLAWTTCCLQMALGLFGYVLPLWGLKLRQAPQVSLKQLKSLIPVAILHSLVHIGGVISMGAGAVSFTYIVKASEPAISCFLSAIFQTSALLPLSVYATLIPVMGGVAIASVSELSFTWKSFNYAMLSNVASASRGVVGKNAMRGGTFHKSMTPSNIYAILTIMATIGLIPLTYLMEGRFVWSTSAITSLLSTQPNLMISYCWNTLLSSLCYYLYNEVSFLALDNVSPVSHAIANTLKRVFIIVSSMLVFGNKMDLRGITGSILAVGGVLWYSLEKQRTSSLSSSSATKKTKK